MTNLRWAWDDARVAAFDFETSGKKPEYALQPWRIARGDAWATSLVWLWPKGRSLRQAGGLDPSTYMIERMLDWTIENDVRMWGWNTAFDISILLAYGFEEHVFKIKWGDGLLLWKHADIEPEYEGVAPQEFGLKQYIRRNHPDHAGYEDDIDFHDTSPAARAELHAYNVRDVAFTLRAARHLWSRLSERQRRAAIIEAECLPFVAQRNLEGLLIDTIAAKDLALRLEQDAERQFTKLAPHIVGTQAAASVTFPKKITPSPEMIAQKVVRSPEKLSTLMFTDWGLTPLKQSDAAAKKAAAGGKVVYSTDKETLHELAFVDPRAKEIKLYREALNQRTKFAIGPVVSADYCDDGGRSHPQAKVFGTYSGRFTYSSKQTSDGIEGDDDGD